MPFLGRRGLTLVELLVALVLLGIVSAGIYRVLVNNQRIYQSQTQRIDLQQNIRAAVTILPAEFRELDASDGDVLAAGATSITIRAMRQLAIVCNTPAILGAGLPVTLVIRDVPFFSTRDFRVGDQIFLYYEGDEATRNDDSWILGTIRSITPGALCSDVPLTANSGGRTVVVNLNFGTVLHPNGVTVLPQIAQTGRIQMGAPMRGWEQVTYRLYQAPDGNNYIGMDNGTGLQPLIGPVLANGFALAYFDSTGAANPAVSQIARIDISVAGQTLQPVRNADGTFARPIDSVTTRVALRNNRRF